MQDVQILDGRQRPGDSIVEVSWPRADAAHVILLGEHDMATAALLARALDDALARASQLVIDLNRAEFIDSSTINTLVRTRRRADDAGVHFNLLVGPDAVARRALEVTDVLAILNAVDSLDDVLRADHNGSGARGNGNAHRNGNR
jgi:anti-anti-sigma factor